MKLTPLHEKVTQRMQPGVLCLEGFLGEDRRPLPEIIDADSSAVAGMGLTHEQIADELSVVLRHAMAAMGTPVEVQQDLSAVYTEAMGRIPSPWPGEGVFAKGEAELTDTRTGTTVRFTPLSVHLIRAHGFYEGKGARYRLAPRTIAAMLRLI